MSSRGFSDSHLRLVNPKRYYTLDELATYLSVKPETIQRWVGQGFIHPAKIGPELLTRYDIYQVNNWLRTLNSPPRDGSYNN